MKSLFRTFFAASLFGAPLIFQTPALADDAPKTGTISVSATGTKAVAPDMAIVNLAVLREAKTAREALTANSKAMAEVLAAMKSEGIEDRDLQTSSFSIQPRYFYPKRKSSGEQSPPKIVGYTVSNALTVRVRDLTRVGSVLDQAVTLGVNSGGGIQFTTDNPKAALQEARQKAMEAAIAKARTLTQSAGVSLGRVLNISEHNRGIPRPRAMARMEKMASDAMPVPVASGENTYSITVQVQWELNQ